MVKIVVLDGYTLNPGDLSWTGLEALGDCMVYDRTPSELAVERAAGAEIVLINKIVLSREVLTQLPALKYVGVLATGYNVVDTAAARELGIVVTNIPVYGTESVAQMVFAHLLNLTQRVGHHARTVSEGRWSECSDFCYWDYSLIELSGLTFGVVGCGRIGRSAARIARAFGMTAIGCDHFLTAAEGIEIVPADEVFRRAEVISLHCPLTPETTKMVNRERLALMKPTALLINTSRGPLIDEEALAEALNAGRIAGAGLDVVSVEPVRPDNPLLTAKNCYVTPHIAWATFSARQRLLGMAVDNVKAFIDGVPQNRVG